MPDDTVQYLQTQMRDNFRAENLKNVGAEEFQQTTLGLIDTVDAEIEGFEDATKQRDISLRYFWGHYHDFGSFDLLHGKGVRFQHEDMLRAGLSRPDIR